MDIDQKKAALEAILFTMGDAVDGERMAAALETTIEDINLLMAELIADYEQQPRGIMITRVGDKYQMCTKVDYYETLIKLCHSLCGSSCRSGKQNCFAVCRK